MSNLRSYCRKGTQLHLIADIFEKNPNIRLSSKQICTAYSLQWLMNQCNEKSLTTDIAELLKLDITQLNVEMPGDVQRQLRTFHDHHGHHGITQTFEGATPYYIYDPSIIHCTIKFQPRSFANDDIKMIRYRNNNRCECCGIPTDEKIPRIKPCADHWRSWSRYHLVSNISSEGNCVLLCQTCNISKSNKPGIHLVRKGICSLITWQAIEDRITRNGFPPNEEETTEIENIRGSLDTA